MCPLSTLCSWCLVPSGLLSLVKEVNTSASAKPHVKIYHGTVHSFYKLRLNPCDFCRLKKPLSQSAETLLVVGVFLINERMSGGCKFCLEHCFFWKWWEHKRAWQGLNTQGFTPNKLQVVLVSSLHAPGCPDHTQSVC